MYGIEEQELTQSYERTLALIDECIRKLIDLKIKATEDYEKKLRELDKEYPEDASRSMKDYQPMHPDNR